MTRLAILFVLIGVGALGCGTSPERSSGSRDHLLGWYELPARDHDTHKVIRGPGTLIPVFKIDRTYYSVCRGFEVPLKECAEGLEWASSPSSMEGTTIGFDAESSEAYIRIVDHGLDGMNDMYIPGEKRFMKKIAKPSWFPMLNAETKPPRTNDDLLGCYQLAWIPAARMTVRREAERYYLVTHLRASGHDDDIIELKPLPDQLGFTSFDDEVAVNLTYNEALKRFEIIPTKHLFPHDRMPLVRVAPEVPSQSDTSPIPTMQKIGIPSWH
jgi:hypothetical protein